MTPFTTHPGSNSYTLAMETLSSSDRSVVDVPLYQTTAYLNTHQNSSYLFGSVPHQRSKSMGQFQYSPSVDPRTRETNSLMTDRYYTNFPIFMGSSSGQQQWMSANSMGNQQRLAPQPTQQNFNRTPDYGRQPPLKTTSYLSTYTQQPPTKLLPTKQSCNSRPFKCDQCPQSFNRTHDLKRHKRIHLALKPFSCRPCEKSFSRKDALKVCALSN